jgi:hypothetical protein
MTPADVRDLTVGEFDRLCSWIDSYREQMKESRG